jgi:hypothetical protein
MYAQLRSKISTTAAYDSGSGPNAASGAVLASLARSVLPATDAAEFASVVG